MSSRVDDSVNVFSEIIDTLEEQSDLSEKLIELSDRKIEYIRNNDTESMLMLVQDEERYSSEMIRLEKKRDFLIKKVEHAKGIKITNISALISQFSEKDSVKLNLVAEKMKINFEILKQKNDINASLLEVILDQVEIYNNLIVGDRVPQTYEDTRYGNKNIANKYSQNNPSGGFDIKY